MIIDKKTIIVVRVPGSTHADLTCESILKAGGNAVCVPISKIERYQNEMMNAAAIVFPDGFSHLQTVLPGQYFGRYLSKVLSKSLIKFIKGGGWILGLHEGFYALVHSGILPGLDTKQVTIKCDAKRSFFLQWETIQCMKCRSPLVNHNDTYWLPRADDGVRILPETNDHLFQSKQAAFCYPDGSIAGICDVTGRVVGLISSPEYALHDWQDPRQNKKNRENEGDGLRFFKRFVEVVNHA